MKNTLATTCFAIGILLVPVAGYTADSDMDRPHAGAFVKDSVITTKIKAKLAEEKMNSLVHISVDTDKEGRVWLSGTAKTQGQIDRAVSIAHDTEGVKSVRNDIKINTNP
jgi:hyperosmotically inducible protein